MEPIHAQKGWFVSHLFYRIDRTRWESSGETMRERSRRCFSDFFSRVSEHERLQIFCYSIWGSRADVGFLVVDPELHHLNQLESELVTTFPPGVLQPACSFSSMTEVSEYLSQEQDYDRVLREKDKLSVDSPEYQEKMGEFRKRMKVYADERLYPTIPPHRVMCFYPMTKARGERENWYLLDFDTRKRYMASHGITGRKYYPHVQQLVTGAVGLDDWEWGVTLFADDPYYFKKIVYEMRYDEASARFGIFGDFLVGIKMGPEELYQRVRF